MKINVEISLTDLIVLHSELQCSIESMLDRGFLERDVYNYGKARYKRLCNLHDKVVSLILDCIDNAELIGIDDTDPEELSNL